MYPSNNYSPISSSNLYQLPSPSIQYEHELFQYFHDHHLLQPQQLQFLTTTADHHQNLDDTNMAEEYSNKDTVINSTNNNNLDEDEEGCKNKKGHDMSRITITSTINKNNINKSSKKDRHSKITTAQGPRDRRMRLSLDVARKFFNLQDLLGFDKASKTVEWLLNKSKSAVKELEEGTSTANIGGAISASSTSDCEVISGIIDESATNDIQKEQPVSGSNKDKKKAKSGRIRAAVNHPVVAKESRKQARARARARTVLRKSLNIGDESKLCNEADVLGSWSPHEESGTQGYTNKGNVVDDSDLVVTTGNWSPFTIINYHHNNEMSHEHQFTNFPFSGKLW